MKNLLFLILLTFAIFACSNDSSENNKLNNDTPVSYGFSDEFNQYWNRGKADLSSYKLQKARYGEIHEGDAALIFVVEPFLPVEQVKSDGLETDEKPEKVMKLIKMDNFFTGIYPYSIMTSTFHPLNKNREGLLKLSMSSQDWCGQVYKQINDRKSHLELQRFSYFQKEGDMQKEIERGLLEEELFTQVRIDPLKLPTGSFSLYPSSKYIRLLHKEFKKYSAEGDLDTSKIESGKMFYSLNYTDLDRELEIEFESSFPHKILGWKETYTGLGGKELTTKAELKKDLHIAYWKHNSNADSTFRKLLGF